MTEVSESSAAQQVKTKQITSWYTSEKKPKRFLSDEILCRVIVWDDAIPNDYHCEYFTQESFDEDENRPSSYQGGFITFYIYDKPLYDRMLKYFNVKDGSPSSFIDSLAEPIEFKLSEKRRYETEWSSLHGSIKCYYPWYRDKRLKKPGKDGKIEIIIDNKKLFDKFVEYVLKFKP